MAQVLYDTETKQSYVQVDNVLHGLKAAITINTTPPQIVCIYWLSELLKYIEAPFSGGGVVWVNVKCFNDIFPLRWISIELGETYLSIADIIKLIKKKKSFSIDKNICAAWDWMIKSFSDMEKESRRKVGVLENADYYPSPSLN